ncbi:hypothetical protein ACIBG8_50160 [Nonomuraea sp. NPDC050556]|uniref:hypothetical protein n=1 Tax=Nonomuraea sp. NPDC050556 TaxID=3364369 RepID=UPI00378C9ED2
MIRRILVGAVVAGAALTAFAGAASADAKPACIPGVPGAEALSVVCEPLKGLPLIGGLLGGGGGGSPLDSVTGLLGGAGGGSPLDGLTGGLGGLTGAVPGLSSVTGAVPGLGAVTAPVTDAVAPVTAAVAP